MQEKDIKTSPKQRVLIAVIAVLLLGASLAAYIAIIVSANSSSSNGNTKVDEAKVTALQEEYEAKNAEYEKLAEGYSSKYLDSLTSYRSQVKSYNASAINDKDTVSTVDVKTGSGDTITATSEGYGAFYIGWCADESVFDSSFDNYESPSKLKAPLVISQDSLIEGWYLGVDGMKLGGARVVSIPGKLAYGDSQEICGGKNSPLKFLIMPVEIDDELKATSQEMSDIYTKLIYAQYGMSETAE